MQNYFYEVCRCKELSDGAKIAWALLYYFGGMSGGCAPSLLILAQELGKSKRQVLRVLKELEDRGFLLREAPGQEGKGRHQTTRYCLVAPPIYSRPVEEEQTP
jgi:DNA-binding MarR family transcriptional regulator